MHDDENLHAYDSDDTCFLGEVVRSRKDRRGICRKHKPFRSTLLMQEETVRKLLLELGCPDLAQRPARELATFGTIFANLSVAPAFAIFYSRNRNDYSDASRYLPKHLTYLRMRRAVDELSEREILHHNRTRPSGSARLRSYFSAREALAHIIMGLSGSCVTAKPKELIVLRDEFKRPTDYVETSNTRAMRHELIELNEFLTGIDLTIEHPDVVPAGLGRFANDGQIVSLSNKTLYRVFTRTFDQNGRFYGAFWQNLPQRVRREGLRINGELVIEIDFRACHFRILCELIGHSLPFNDPAFDPFSIPGFERRLVKTAFVILLNTRSSRGVQQALAKDFAERRGEVRARTEDFQLAERVLVAMAMAFPFLHQFSCTGFGLRLLNIDAQICAETLRMLKALGVPCLPVHDSFIVAARHRVLLAQVMENAFRTVMQKQLKAPRAFPVSVQVGA